MSTRPTQMKSKDITKAYYKRTTKKSRLRLTDLKSPML